MRFRKLAETGSSPTAGHACLLRFPDVYVGEDGNLTKYVVSGSSIDSVVTTAVCTAYSCRAIGITTDGIHIWTNPNRKFTTALTLVSSDSGGGGRGVMYKASQGYVYFSIFQGMKVYTTAGTFLGGVTDQSWGVQGFCDIGTYVVAGLSNGSLRVTTPTTGSVIKLVDSYTTSVGGRAWNKPYSDGTYVYTPRPAVYSLASAGTVESQVAVSTASTGGTWEYHGTDVYVEGDWVYVSQQGWYEDPWSWATGPGRIEIFHFDKAAGALTATTAYYYAHGEPYDFSGEGRYLLSAGDNRTASSGTEAQLFILDPNQNASSSMIH